MIGCYVGFIRKEGNKNTNNNRANQVQNTRNQEDGNEEQIQPHDQPATTGRQRLNNQPK